MHFCGQNYMHLYIVRIKVFHSDFQTYGIFRLISSETIFGQYLMLEKNSVFSKIHRFVMFPTQIHVFRSGYKMKRNMWMRGKLHLFHWFLACLIIFGADGLSLGRCFSFLASKRNLLVGEWMPKYDS